MKKLRVMMVGSAEQSGGGVSSVIRLMKRMPIWQKYDCYWLGTQIQESYSVKLWYAIKANIIAPFIMWRYDIVHFHTDPDIPGQIIQLPIIILSRLYRKKTIIQIHVGNQLKDNTNNHIFKWCLRKADKIVLLAKKWEDLFNELYTDVNVPTCVIYNACDEKEGNGERTQDVIYAGYFDENKAPDILIKAWKYVTEEHQGWKLTMMGNGDSSRYRELAHSLGLDESISFPGYLTGEEKSKVWNKASILCLCSYQEGFPMVVLEAWAKGIAVVTTPVGGLPDVIEEERNCITFDYGNPEMLAHQLSRLIEDTLLRETLIKNGKLLVKNKFSLEIINKELELMYESL